MKNLRYFFEFLIILFLFIVFRIIGYKNASNFGELIGKIIGPKFKSKKIISENIKIFNPILKIKKWKLLLKKCGVIMEEF